jgi:hypothetical protein
MGTVSRLMRQLTACNSEPTPDVGEPQPQQTSRPLVTEPPYDDMIESASWLPMQELLTSSATTPSPQGAPPFTNGAFFPVYHTAANWATPIGSQYYFIPSGIQGRYAYPTRSTSLSSYVTPTFIPPRRRSSAPSDLTTNQMTVGFRGPAYYKPASEGGNAHMQLGFSDAGTDSEEESDDYSAQSKARDPKLKCEEW